MATGSYVRLTKKNKSTNVLTAALGLSSRKPKKSFLASIQQTCLRKLEDRHREPNMRDSQPLSKSTELQWKGQALKQGICMHGLTKDTCSQSKEKRKKIIPCILV